MGSLKVLKLWVVQACLKRGLFLQNSHLIYVLDVPGSGNRKDRNGCSILPSTLIGRIVASINIEITLPIPNGIG